MSSIPDTPDFRLLIDSLSVSTGGPGLKIREETPGVLADGSLVTFPPLYLMSCEDGKIKLAALNRKLCDSWQGSEHPCSSNLADLALAIFAILKISYPDPLALFNQLLESTGPVDVSHFAVFPNMAQDGQPAEFAGFRFGKVQSLSLQYRSTRAKSDYFELHGNRLNRRHGMESPVYKRAVVRFLDLGWQSPTPANIPEKLFHEVLLRYYTELSAIYTERMWQDLDDKQAIGTAAGIEAFGVPSLKRSIGLASISVYLNQTKQRWDGYVVPEERSVFNMNSWIGSPPILQKLENFQSGLTFPPSPTLFQVSRFGVCARRAATRSDWAEALLNFTIALEMLFSEKNQTSQAVSRRFAVVASEPTPGAFTTHRKEILSLYDSRSQYVHAGIAPTQANVESMTFLFEKALTVLIRLEKKQILHDKDQFNRWIKHLDWIASGYEAGQVPADDVLEDTGLKESV